MEINRDNVFEIINKAGLKPDKDYGQNYLLDAYICQRIVDLLEVNDNEQVLEIGPGLGSLTHFLSLTKGQLTLVDIDQRMIDFLKIFYKDGIHYVLNDIRKVDVSSYDKIIGNLPYNITTELVTFLLLNSYAKKMVLMCQSEAFNRFYDLSGENYGPVSILLHLLGTSKKVLTVKPGSFYPAPKCNSLVFIFDSNSTVDKETAINVYKMSKTIFLNRRKTILNCLTNYTHDKVKANDILEKLGVNLLARPEQLGIEFYSELNKILSKKD